MLDPVGIGECCYACYVLQGGADAESAGHCFTSSHPFRKEPPPVGRPTAGERDDDDDEW